LNPAAAARTIDSVPDWLHDLPVPWLVAFVFVVAVLVTAAIYATVISLSTGERGRAFASISPGLLPPMGIMFALLVGFLAEHELGPGEPGHQHELGEPEITTNCGPPVDITPSLITRRPPIGGGARSG
jgi:hypothetical protein